MPSPSGSKVRMTPRPLQHSHGVENASSRPAPTRFLVIWTRPSEVTSATWCLVRSLARHSSSRRSTRSLLDSSAMSMKSMTTMPPTSRSRSWRTSSSAASRLLRVTVSSRFPPWPVNLPVFTSTTVIASVLSMTSEPPAGQPPLALEGFGELLADPVRGEHILAVRLWRLFPAAEPVCQVRRDVPHVLVDQVPAVVAGHDQLAEDLVAK